MRSIAIGALFAATLLWAAPVLPQSTEVQPGNQNIVFIHCGPKEPTDPAVQKVAIALLKEGFLVREPEPDQDKVGGAGIDYFDERVLPTAEKIAKIVNEALGTTEGKKLTPRPQRTRNPGYYFGVWLFSPS
jgi:hypothetical protein